MNEPLLQPPHDPNQRTIMIVVYVLFGLGVITRYCRRDFGLY